MTMFLIALGAIASVFICAALLLWVITTWHWLGEDTTRYYGSMRDIDDIDRRRR